MPGFGDAAMILAMVLIALSAGTVVWLLMRQRADRPAPATAEPAPRADDRVGRVLERIGDAFLTFDPAWRLDYANPEAMRLLGTVFSRMASADGVPSDEDRHRQFRVIVQEYETGEMAGARVVLDRWLATHSHPSVEGVAFYLHDNTERRTQEERARAASLVDDLTGLYNRRGFLTLAEQHLKLAERAGRNVLLIFADLDDFKDINDRYGHQEGDRALADTARVIRHVFRDSDIVARLGGDEFVILALETSDLSGDILSRRLREALASKNHDAERAYALTLSVGVARYNPRNPAPIADLLARADALMYEHKREKDAARREDPRTPQLPLHPPVRREPRVARASRGVADV